MKKCLIIVDFQKDFVDGSLGFAGAAVLDDRIVKKISACQKEQTHILFTLDTHGLDYLDTQEGRRLPVPHCQKPADGWALYGKTAAYLPAAQAVFEKNTFGSLALADFLRAQQYGRVELVGLVSNICVLSNAVLAKAALPEADIVVDAACTDSFDKAMHEKALDILEGIHVQVINR